MNKRDIEKLIISQRNNIVPDVLNNIMQNASVSPAIIPQEKTKKNFNLRFKIAAAVSMAVVILISGLFYYNYQNQEMSIIYIDINPSLGLVISRNYRIKSVIIPDEEQIFDNELNLVGKNAEDAIIAVVDYAIKKGYITPENQDNALSLSVLNIDTKKNELLSKMSAKSNDYFKQKNINCTVLENMYSKETKESADEINISPGKLNIINKIISYDNTLTIDDLKDKSIRDLNSQLKILKEKQDRK